MLQASRFMYQITFCCLYLFVCVLVGNYLRKPVSLVISQSETTVLLNATMEALRRFQSESPMKCILTKKKRVMEMVWFSLNIFSQELSIFTVYGESRSHG